MKFFYVVIMVCEFFLSFNTVAYAEHDYGVVVSEVVDELANSKVAEIKNTAKKLSLEVAEVNKADSLVYYNKIHKVAFIVGILAIDSDVYDSFDKLLNSGLPHHAIIQSHYKMKIGEFFLYQAIEKEKIHFVERLIDWGVDLNESGQLENFLVQAALKNNEEIVQLLLEKGAMKEKIENAQIIDGIARLAEIYNAKKYSATMNVFKMAGLWCLVFLPDYWRQNYNARWNFLFKASIGGLALVSSANIFADLYSRDAYKNLKDLESKNEKMTQLIYSVSEKIKLIGGKSSHDQLEQEISSLLGLEEDR